MAWFKKFHPEQIPSAIDRYTKEVHRVTGVLNDCLSRQQEKYGNANNGPWLVADKMSYADVSWVMWQKLMVVFGALSPDEYPFARDWVDKMMELEEVKTVFDRAMASNHDGSEWEGFDKYLP